MNDNRGRGGGEARLLLKFLSVTATGKAAMVRQDLPGASS